MKIKVFKVGYTGNQILEIENELEVFQKHVGGYIECVNFPGSNGMLIVCDEEGKLKNKPVMAEIPNDTINGEFLIVGMGLEDFTGLTTEQLESLQLIFD